MAALCFAYVNFTKDTLSNVIKGFLETAVILWGEQCIAQKQQSLVKGA